MLLLICVVPLTILLAYLLIMTNKISSEYDGIVRRITKANAYNINFKEDMDYVMYIIVVNSERAEELVDTEQPHRMIQAAREVFGELYEEADSEYAANRLSSILKSLDTLEDRVEEIEKDALVTGLYETNMERLDLNIRVLTELIQEQIQYYIYYETTNMEELRMGIRADVESAITAITVILVLILLGAWMVSRRIVRGITEPIQRLCEAAQAAGSGDFAIRAQDEELDELSVLNSSFNQMVEEIGHLVEDIRVEELNLRAADQPAFSVQYTGQHHLARGVEGHGAGREDGVVPVKLFSDNLKQGAGVHHGKGGGAAHPQLLRDPAVPLQGYTGI